MFSSNTSAVSADAVFVEDVMSTTLYTGNGSTQTITNGIDLSTKGGLVWIKARSIGYWHAWHDTARGVDKRISSNESTAQETVAGSVTAFNTNGFSLGSEATTNDSNVTYASWTFRKQPKFFDVVTYTGDGVNGRQIPHNLGSTPGVIILKAVNDASGWATYHRSLGATKALLLNTTDTPYTLPDYWNNTEPTATNFTVGSGWNVNGINFVAYLFAHDAGGFGLTGTDNVISCGSVAAGTTNQTITLGYEPQFVLFKKSSAAGNWFIADNMRGITTASNGFGNDITLQPNTSATEDTTGTGFFSINATGMRWETQDSSTYIYIAIRRGPMKTPTDATKVFTPTVYTGTNVDNRLVDTTIAPDMVWVRQRNDTVLGGMVVGDRLRGNPYLLTGTTAAEVDDADAFDKQLVSTTEYGTAFSSMSGFWCGNDATAKLNANTTSNNHIAEAFKRAPGFFDVVCYTGTGVARTVNHNLGVVPELMIVKRRNSSGSSWCVYSAPTTASNVLFINDTSESLSSALWDSTTPTSSVFSVGSLSAINASGSTYVAYLFASCPGVSKVGSYTGTGATLQIDCGFTGGARFVLIKRTDSTGDWFVWDSARGIVSGNDPYLRLNSTAAEVTNTDYVDTYSAGFEISSTAPADINANGGTYIFLAIA